MKALKFYKELKESEPSTSSRESEVASADEEAARNYPEKLAKIIKDGEYCAHQVFNADETGLFWKNANPYLHCKVRKKLPVVLKLLKIELLYCCAAMHLAIESIAEIKSQTLNACWKAAWPECVSKGNESNRAIVTSEIISIAKEIGGEGFDDFGEHDIEELLVDEALNDDDILESMVDITKDLETVDSEPEEDVTPLDEKLLRKGLQLSDVAREFDIGHSVVSRLWKSFKTTGMCSRRHGEVVLEVRRLQKTDISSYQQKGTGAPQLSRWQISFLLPQESKSPEKLLTDV
ncbi:DDE-1 domain-containing protein [Trichonephila clavipes]|nr:DDE-1 domain-containing protein [Trichonephila clavipes]